ncbi:MAG: hypothetical protein KJO40_19580 [Deltaproteobacteria bacterium]|nr:hypothetical protein [Deltaproteobacteria bacterium]
MNIACFASIPTREHPLRRAVHSMLDQVDYVYVYCNGLKVPPKGLEDDRISVTLSREAGWKGSEAKWYWSDGAKFRMHQLEHVDVYFTCDDDIEYPSDYVASMTAALDRHPGSVVGVHGVRLKEPVVAYPGCIDLYANFRVGLEDDARCHLLGTGTVAFRPAELPDFDLSTFYIPNMADVWLGVWARERGIELWTPRRQRKWLKPLATHGFSISASHSRRQDMAEVELLQLHSPWPKLPPWPRRRP